MIMGKSKKGCQKFSFHLVKFHLSAGYVTGGILELEEIRTGKDERKS